MYVCRKENRGDNTSFYNARTVGIRVEKELSDSVSLPDKLIISIPKSLIYHSGGLDENAFGLHASL